MLTNVQKSPILQWWRKWKSDPESTSRCRSSPKVKRFLRVTLCPYLPSLIDVRFRVRYLYCLQNDRQNDHITSALLAKVTTTSTQIQTVTLLHTIKLTDFSKQLLRSNFYMHYNNHTETVSRLSGNFYRCTCSALAQLNLPSKTTGFLSHWQPINSEKFNRYFILTISV